MNKQLPEIFRRIDDVSSGGDFSAGYNLLIRLGAVEKYVGGTNIVRLAGITGSSTAGTSDQLARSWLRAARRTVEAAKS